MLAPNSGPALIAQLELVQDGPNPLADVEPLVLSSCWQSFAQRLHTMLPVVETCLCPICTIVVGYNAGDVAEPSANDVADLVQSVLQYKAGATKQCQTMKQ